MNSKQYGMWKLLTVFFFAGLALAVAPLSASSPLQPRGENFEPVDCATFEITDEAFECGYISVPELHALPDGKHIKLAVAILPSTSAGSSEDAFVIAQGGPGGSTLDTFASFLQLGIYPAIEKLRAERDIILYDQRGTLYAEPSLMCPEELELTFETIDDDIPRAKELELGEAAALKCRERLVAEGVNLAAYNSVENALDIEDVRRALGYNKFDFYGVSYGTLLALHGLRETPQSFRSVILDAVVPTQLNPNSAIAQSQQRAFNQLFAACVANADCQRAYPDLGQTFYDVMDKLNQTPARVHITDSETGEAYDAVINGNTFLDILFQFIYNTEILPVLPQMIYDAQVGRFGLLETYYPLIAFDRTFASGMYYSVMCAEDADFTPGDLALDGVDPHLAAPQKIDTAAFIQLCQKWDVPQLGARADEPVSSSIPTLIFSGEFDPITPPPFGAAAAESINPNYLFVFPGYGHGAMTSGDCPIEMIVDFVRDPGTAPDASCIATDAAQVPFLTPSNYIFLPGIGKLQFDMLQGQVASFVVPILFVPLLLTVWLIAPLAWLIRRSQKRPSEPQLLARLAPWLIAIGSALALTFFVMVFGLVILTALRNDNTIGLVLGAPRAWGLVYWLPLLFTLCEAVFTAAVVLAWRHGNWEVWRRLYFAILAVLALGLASWFALNGVLLPF